MMHASACRTCTPPSGHDSHRMSFLAAAHLDCDAPLRRFFLGKGMTPHDVDDMIQEVYLRLAGCPDLSAVRNVRAFAFTTAANLLRDVYRRKLTRPTVACEHPPDVPAESADPALAAEFEQQLRIAERLIAQLKPVTKRVFWGHRIAGQSYAELSREIGVSVSMIEKHMISAIAVLRPLQQDAAC